MQDALTQALEAHRAGRLAEAERTYLAILQEQPSNADVLHLLGLIAHQRGDHERARDLVGAALSASPGNLAARFNFGGILAATGDVSGAIAEYERVVAESPKNAAAFANLGNAYRTAGRFEDARGAYDAALAQEPAQLEALVGMGAVLADLSRAGEAVAFLERAVAASPNLGAARVNLANALRQAHRYPEALEACAAALALEDGAAARLLLGQTLFDVGRLDEARVELERALALDPKSADVLTNLGVYWYVRGDAERSISYSERAIELDTRHVQAHFNLSMAYLLAGRFREGWREFEWRARDRGRSADFRYESLPRWEGGSFDGRRLLISREQGLGDLLFVARYLPAVAALGGEIVLEVAPEAAALMQRQPGIEVHDSSLGPYPIHRADLQCPAFTLPLTFDTVEASIPATVPYLAAGVEQIAHWRDRLRLRRGDVNVAVVWRGFAQHRLDRFRSCALREFEALASVRGVRWFALQKGPGESELREPGISLQIEALGQEIRDLDDTAAIVSLLDLVITVDTSVAHLAGALARPVWTVLGLGTDWRWLLGRSDSPWYPTMRLFRQSIPGDWSGPFAAVAAALEQLVAERARE